MHGERKRCPPVHGCRILTVFVRIAARSRGQPIREVIFVSKNKRKGELPRFRPDELERPINPAIYPVIDTDLARDNVENDLSDADLQSL